MGSPTSAVRFQNIDTHSAYDIKGQTNLLDTSFTHISQYNGQGGGAKMTLAESL